MSQHTQAPVIRSVTLTVLTTMVAISACGEDPLRPVERASPAPQLTLQTSSSSTALTASLSPAAEFAFTSLAHGMSFARGINDAGLVVGDYGGNNIATVWTEGGGFHTIGRLDGSTSCCSSLVDVNASGDAVGFSHTYEPPHVATMLWSQAANTNVNLRVPRRAYGQAINDEGHVVGGSFELGTSFTPFYRPTGGSAIDMQLPAGAVGATARDINAAGAIVGSSDISGLAGGRAVLWPRWDAAAVDLGTLGGARSFAWGVNNAGDIVGWSETANGEQHAFLWTSGAGMIDLNTWPNSCAGASEAFAINQAGVIVGKCGGRPVVWTATEGMRTLPLPSGVTTGEARAINAKNQIVGSFNGFGAALWTLANSPPSVSAGGPYAGAEGSPTRFDFSASDPDGDALTYSWDLGDGTTGEGPVPPAGHTYADDASYTVTLTVSDGKGGTDTKSTTLTVANVAPIVGPVAAPLDPQPVGSSISIAASITDPGTADTHTGAIDWGDGSSSAAGIVAGTAVGTHTYVAPGVYTVTLSVDDDDDGRGGATFQYLVIYDRAAGFVTGGGWIDSPVGAYAADPALAGRGSFGFVSRYQSGATTPSGVTQFQFRAGGLDFHSTRYDWLVVSGPKAQYKGIGTINRSGDYGFVLSATDGQVAAGGGVDRFRIKIWDRTTGAVIYDNQTGDSEDAAPWTTLGGGSITIHR